MRTRKIGMVDVSAVGLGAMPLSVSAHVETAQALRTIHAALDAGCRLIDTADAYTPDASMGHNERIVAKALRTWSGDPDEVLVATKGGHTRPDGAWHLDGSRSYLRRACEASLRALGVDVIGLYQHHRPDPTVTYTETVGALAELREAGLVRMVGISNADVEQIATAVRMVDIASVQNEHSPRFRSSRPEIELCEQLGIAFLAWSPLGGMGDAKALGGQHPAFAEVAAERGVSAQRVCLAWQLATSPAVIPIPGASRPSTILDSLAATDLELSPDELERLEASVL